MLQSELIGKDELAEDSALEAVVHAIGWRGLNRLIERVGGLVVKVPVNVLTLFPGHVLVDALGLKDAKALVMYCPGERIYIPNGVVDDRVMARDAAFLAAVKEGKSNMEIARDFGCSDRWVRKVLAKLGVKNRNRSTMREAVSSGGPAANDSALEKGRRMSPDDPEFIRRAKVYKQWRKGKIPTHALAALRLSMTLAAWKLFVRKHRELLEESIQSRIGMPTVSNGGLTGLGRPSGNIPSPNNENASTAR